MNISVKSIINKCLQPGDIIFNNIDIFLNEAPTGRNYTLIESTNPCYDDTEDGMIIKKIVLLISILCICVSAFLPISCTAKSPEKTAQEAADALAIPFAPIDFDKAESEGLQKE